MEYPREIVTSKICRLHRFADKWTGQGHCDLKMKHGASRSSAEQSGRASRKQFLC